MGFPGRSEEVEEGEAEASVRSGESVGVVTIVLVTITIWPLLLLVVVITVVPMGLVGCWVVSESFTEVVGTGGGAGVVSSVGFVVMATGGWVVEVSTGSTTDGVTLVSVGGTVSVYLKTYCKLD